MSLEIRYSVETERGCGFRKEGGLYFVCDAKEMKSCGKFPITLDVCPCCGGGIKFSRGFTWVSSDIISRITCRDNACILDNKACPFSRASMSAYHTEKFGLMWVGEKFYKTDVDFFVEAAVMGISKRIRNIPRGFVVGETWVLLAHRKVGGRQAIFLAFKPSAVEYVVRKEDTEEYLLSLQERGIKLVRVEPLTESQFALNYD